jgi:hypothetical protein
MPRGYEILDQVTTALKFGRPVAKLIPVVGDNLEGAVEIAINICERAQVPQPTNYVYRIIHSSPKNLTGSQVKQGYVD